MKIRKTRLIVWVGVMMATLVPPSFGQDFSKVQFHTKPLGKGLHLLAGGGGNVIVSVSDDGLLMIDASYSQLSEKLLDAAKEISDKPVRYLINTHWHFDHVGGNEALGKAGATIIAHENVRKCMSEERTLRGLNMTIPASPIAALPTMTYSEAMTLHWNNEEIKLHHAIGHTNGDSIVIFRDANVMHVGDLWFNGTYPFMDLNAGGSIDGIIDSVDEAVKMANDETIIVPGHGRVSDLKGLKAYRKMLSSIRDTVQSLIKQGKTRDEIIAAKPTRAYDTPQTRYGMHPDQWIGLVYDGLTQEKAKNEKPA